MNIGREWACVIPTDANPVFLGNVSLFVEEILYVYKLLLTYPLKQLSVYLLHNRFKQGVIKQISLVVDYCYPWGFPVFMNLFSKRLIVKHFLFQAINAYIS